MYFWKGDVASAENCYKRVINMPNLPPCPQLLKCLQRYAKLCVKNDREKDGNILYKRMEDLSTGKTPAALPDNMKYEAPAAGDNDKASATTGSDKPAAASDADKSSTGDKAGAGENKPAGDKPAASDDKSAPASK